MGELYLLVVDFREAQMRYAEEEERSSSSSNESIVDFEKMMMTTQKKTWKRWKGKTPLRDKSSLRHLLDAIAASEEETEVEEKRRRKEIVLLCGGEGCKGVNILRAFQLFLGLSSRCLWTTRVTMRVEHKTLIPVVKTNGNRQDWLRVRSSGDGFEWGCGIGAECAEGWRMEVRRLAKTLAENTSGTTFREDENALTMSYSSSASSSGREEDNKDKEEDTRDYFPSVQLGVREQLLEVSNDISKLFRHNRERYRSDDGTFAVVASTRERYDKFKKWHYVESLPTLYGVYLEVIRILDKDADNEDEDDDKNLIGYASFHTEQAPPQFENVVDNLNASKVQRFCVVNRLVVNPKYRGRGLGVKELLLIAGCDSYHTKGIACRITTSAYTAKVSLDACKLLAFERFKSRKDTGKERSSGKRKIVVNVPSTQKSNVNDDDDDEKKEREVKKDVLRMLNALTPDSSAKLTPKLRERFNALSEDDKVYVSGYIISLARVAPQFRKLLADVVLCTRLEPIVRKDAKIEIEKLSTTSSSSHLSEEEVSARLRFLNAFVSEMNSEQSASRYLGTKDSALAMSRQDVFTAAKRDMKALRIIEEDSNTVAEVKRGQRSGWSYIYIGTPVVRRFDGQKYIFDGETNRFISRK